MPKLPIISGKQLLSALKKSGFIEVRPQPCFTNEADTR